MERPDQDEFTDLIHRQLMKLPERTAPENLIPRVLRRIERRQRCWWLRPWGTWPFSAKCFSLPLLASCLGAWLFGAGLVAGLPLADWIGGSAEGFLRPAASGWELLVTLGRAVVLVEQSLAQPWVLAVVGGIVFLMYLTCLAVGTVCFRVVFTPAKSR